MSAYDPLALVYDDWASEMAEDVAFYVELAREVGADAGAVEKYVWVARKPR